MGDLIFRPTVGTCIVCGGQVELVAGEWWDRNGWMWVNYPRNHYHRGRIIRELSELPARPKPVSRG